MKRICVVILLATALSLSQLACSSGNAPAANANNPNEKVFTSTANAPGTANTGPTVLPSNANATNDPFPELVMLYSQLFTARMKGDKAKVEGLLADDYKETTGDGKTLSKAQVLSSINLNQKDTPFQLDDLKSTITGETGTVTGRVTITPMEGGHSESWQVNETFRKQGGHWQAVSSKATDYKKT